MNERKMLDVIDEILMMRQSYVHAMNCGADIDAKLSELERASNKYMTFLDECRASFWAASQPITFMTKGDKK